MDKQEMKAKFEKNVEYLRRNVPPDDIYMFSEQTFMAALFFISKWAAWVDIIEECQKCEVTRKWITNIIGLQVCRDKEEDIDLDLDLKSVEE